LVICRFGDLVISRFAVLCVAAVCANAPEQLSKATLARVDAAVRHAFSFLYALPSDTAAAKLGSWVVDSGGTTAEPDPSGRWRLVVTKLADTGSALKISEMLGTPGTSPAELAAAVVAMQRLEGKISKSEAEASLEVVVTLDPSEVATGAASDDAVRSQPAIAGAQLTLRTGGHWVRATDRELETDYERWSPATFTVRFRNVTVTARGNEEMLDRVIRETRWDALAALSP
jgi:hypothetical protein